ncbi:MAG: hypothetical protein KC413_12185 [Anaerolineales bacterium]|nr:hypothetical protein [Anaerolineales bacterium]
MDELEKLVTAVLASPKYQHISPDLVQRIGTRELTTRRNAKEALKATKNKLHQVGGAYFEAKIDYERALARLRETHDDADAFRATCRDLMRRHASTRERLPILDEFYQTVLAHLPPIHSVLDVACGLNVLTWPWLPLSPDTHYYACDIYGDMIAFVSDVMQIAGISGAAEVRDVVSEPPARPVDLVLLLKLLPVLEQVEKTAVSHLLDTLNARYLLISFPVASLGGRSKGMAANYEAQFETWAAGRNWHVQRFSFATELAFLVQQTNTP